MSETQPSSDTEKSLFDYLLSERVHARIHSLTHSVDGEKILAEFSRNVSAEINNILTKSVSVNSSLCTGWKEKFVRKIMALNFNDKISFRCILLITKVKLFLRIYRLNSSLENFLNHLTLRSREF